MRALLCLLLMVSTVHAESLASPPDLVESLHTRTLPPDRLDAIRAIGRNVLSAKARAQDDPSDAEHVERLRMMVDKLIAMEAPRLGAASISLENKAQPTRKAPQSTRDGQLDAARTEAWDVAGQLRHRGGALRAQTKPTGAGHEAYTAGLPVAPQRGRLFERWADALETALADGNPDRLPQLRTLQQQLLPAKRGVIATPLAHGTPTLQAMPWDAVSSAPKAKKAQRRNKSKK